MDFFKDVVLKLKKAVGNGLTKKEIANLLEKPKSEDHGDVAFPTFSLAKKMKKAPHLIAAEVAEKIDSSAFLKIEVVGPYINFFLKRGSLSSEVLSTIVRLRNDYGSSKIGEGRNVPIDMSSPNIAKPFSMGHLRSTVIGNVIANTYEKIGYTPIRINHLGDWGTQFGKLIVAFRLWGTESDIRENPIQELLKLYVRFHEEAEKDPALDDEARLWFKKLEDGDMEARTLWKWFSSESLEEFNRIYELLDISFDHYTGESFYNDKMDEVVELLEAKHLLKTDQGAQIVDLSKYDLNPALIKRSDGATLYMTRDIATAIYRKRSFDFAQSLYVVGNEQSMHFEQLKKVLLEMGFDWANDMHHIPFGLITKDGKKLSTRKGKIVLLEEVINEAIDRALSQIEEKNPMLKNKMEVSQSVGVGAVVFNDLKNDRLNNVDFNLNDIVRFEGETGPYVQYAHARCCSLLRKIDLTVLQDRKEFELSDAESWEIIKLLNDFPQVIQRSADNYEPSIIAKYTIKLAQSFNRYYANVKILEDDSEMIARAALIQSIADVLEEGLRILGIKAPKEM